MHGNIATMNNQNMAKRTKNILTILLIAILFLFVSYFANQYNFAIREAVEKSGIFGILMYLVISIIAIVFAPISMIPLIPLASGIWGWFWAGVLSIIGWAIGSQIAFWLARRFGHPFVEKYIGSEKLKKIEKWIPSKNMFFSVIFLRMAIPVDILSYALGLFTEMSYLSYFIATVIGIAPFAFVYAYAGTFPINYQLLGIFGFLIIFIFGSIVVHLRKK